MRSLVSDSLDSCDVAIVIATPDGDAPNGKGKQPSPSVLVEIGNLQKMEQFKGKYIIIKEDSVVFSSMIPEVHYRFKMSDLSPIAVAILIELGSMGMYRNYYELPGSDLEIHELFGALSNLKDMKSKGLLNPDQFKTTVEDIIRKVIDKLMGVS